VNGDTIEKLTQDLDSEEKYLFNTVSFLEDIGWLKQDFLQKSKYKPAHSGLAI
jgi:hypothetical protein